jgi:putative DNA primase/helicase
VASVAEQAEALLLELLTSGPRDAREIRTVAEGANISKRTMQRAADALGVVKTKAGFMGGWTWALPLTEAA